VKRGEAWWVEFDPFVGSENRKTRPAVIVRNDAANRNLARVVVVPLTRNTGRPYPGEAVVSLERQSSKAMADQLMAADKARLKAGSVRSVKPICRRWKMLVASTWAWLNSRQYQDETLTVGEPSRRICLRAQMRVASRLA